jgi:putative transposase
MPRRPRIFLPGHPQHIVVRGHNRDPIVARKVDFLRFTGLLDQALQRYGVALHAWVLMTNHVHLLVTPGDEASISRTMQWLGAHYAHYFNSSYRRRGALWEGRYKSSLVGTDRYFLLCHRYIEMNPVRAGMVRLPSDYPWSSYRENAGLEGVGAEAPTPKPRLTPHELYLSLGKEADRRHAAYRAMFDEVLDRKTLTEFRRSTQRQKPVGSAEFMLRVARMR